MTLEEEKFDEVKRANEEWELSKMDTLTIVRSLYERGVTIRDIFGRYYEFEEAGNGRLLDVEDAELAGVCDNNIKAF